MKVTLVIYSLSGGGAERVMSILANYWADRGWDITLMTLVDSTQVSFYPLDPRIDLKSLGVAEKSTSLLGAIVNVWRRLRTLRREIIASEADIAIGFMNAVNVYTILACWGTNIPTIVSEHTYPGANDANKIWQFIMKLTYRYADLVTVLTQSALPFYPTAAGYPTIVMPNPILTPAPAIVKAQLLPRSSLIAIGRLDPRKGFDLLLKAFAQIHPQYPDWQLTILGEGSIRAELEELRSQLKLEACVHLPGSVPNVRDYLLQADIFVMSSRVEGFPMALCEAMACGLPVIATDCLSGPREIIKDGIDGVLVETENVDALAAGLAASIADPVKCQQLAQNAPGILDRFGLEQVMSKWKEAIETTIVKKTQYRSTRQLVSHIDLLINNADFKN
jgi:GalNAc-alpha-(1->4)-GalNAc-alpha-(1->3)-diNAcBac-PP-undecaprenol alpha-1,4-N-acetyl-D-galactosaminyltransferase